MSKNMYISSGLFACRIDSTNQNKEYINAIAVVGEWRGHNNGSFNITLEDLKTIIKNFEAQKSEIVIDYEHQTLNGTEAPAGGWINKLLIDGDKLLAHHTLTPKALEYIKNNEYKYVSPVFIFDSIDQVSAKNIGITLHSVALTNKPFIDTIGEIVANKNQFKKETKMDEIEALKSENKELKTKVQTYENELTTLKEQIAIATVDSAIVANKLPAHQKDWAIKYCKSDLKGFEEFIANQDTQKEAIQAPQNNMFANKATNNSKNDVVALAFED